MTTMPSNPTPAEGVVVPLEPMPEMLAAFWRQKNTGSQVPGETGDDRSDYAAYRAMLAARPAAANPATILSLATLIEAQAAEIEGLTGAIPDLFSVIKWLENGCDPAHAATELRIYQERIDHARRAFLASRTERSDA